MLIPERIPKATRSSSTTVHPPFSSIFSSSKPGDGWGQNLNCFHPPCAGLSESSPTAVRTHVGFHRVAGGFFSPGWLWGKWSSAMKIALLGLGLFDWTGEDELPIIMKIASENNIITNYWLIQLHDIVFSFLFRSKDWLQSASPWRLQIYGHSPTMDWSSSCDVRVS